MLIETILPGARRGRFGAPARAFFSALSRDRSPPSNKKLLSGPRDPAGAPRGKSAPARYAPPCSVDYGGRGPILEPFFLRGNSVPPPGSFAPRSRARGTRSESCVAGDFIHYSFRSRARLFVAGSRARNLNFCRPEIRNSQLPRTSNFPFERGVAPPDEFFGLSSRQTNRRLIARSFILFFCSTMDALTATYCLRTAYLARLR